MEVGGQPHALVALPPGNELPYVLNGRLGGPLSVSGGYDTVPRLELGSLARAALDSRNTDCPIAPHFLLMAGDSSVHKRLGNCSSR
jgi:hypothetical protein